MFYRAWVGMDLSPHERAIIRFVEGLFGSVLIAATTAAVQYLAQQPVNARLVLNVFVGTVLLAAWQAAIKYLRAHADLPLGQGGGLASRPSQSPEAFVNDTGPRRVVDRVVAPDGAKGS